MARDLRQGEARQACRGSARERSERNHPTTHPFCCWRRYCAGRGVNPTATVTRRQSAATGWACRLPRRASRCMKPTTYWAMSTGCSSTAKCPARAVTGSRTVSRRMQSSGDRRTLGSAPEPETAMQTVVDSREFLAEERTLLAWLRTSLGIAALGFVLDRFSLFLRAMHVSTGVSPGHLPHIQGFWLVLLSLAVNILAIARHLVTIRAMRRAGLESAAPQSPVLIVAVLL